MSIPHTGLRPRTLRDAVRLALARPQGCRLVDREALRLRGRSRRDDPAHDDFAQRHRRQSRSLRRFLVPRLGDDRTLPDNDVRRRGALSRRPSAVVAGESPSAAAPILIPIMRLSAARSAACAGRIAASRSMIAIRSDRRSPASSTASCRFSISGTNTRRKRRSGVDRGGRRNACRRADRAFVVDGQFKGGSITRGFGQPDEGVHALQMELACRAYMREPRSVDARNWPTPYEPAYAASTRGLLEGKDLSLIDPRLDRLGTFVIAYPSLRAKRSNPPVGRHPMDKLLRTRQ